MEIWFLITSKKTNGKNNHGGITLILNKHCIYAYPFSWCRLGNVSFAECTLTHILRTRRVALGLRGRRLVWMRCWSSFPTCNRRNLDPTHSRKNRPPLSWFHRSLKDNLVRRGNMLSFGFSWRLGYWIPIDKKACLFRKLVEYLGKGWAKKCVLGNFRARIRG